MSNIRRLVKQCNYFYKLSAILPPPMEEGEEYDMPEIPRHKVPKELEQEGVDTQRPGRKIDIHERDTFRPPSKDTSYEEDEPRTIPAPTENLLEIDEPFGLFEEVSIPKAPKIPREFAETERPKKK